MKVLHVYSHDNPRLAMYVSLLSQAMPPGVECVCVGNADDLRKAIGDFRPDIVHQHGHFPPAAMTDARDCPQPARLVVSPHGERTDNHGAYAMIARSPYEMTTLSTGRKELVQNPLITRTITFREAAETIMRVYQRVADSHPLEHIPPEGRRLLAVLLKAGTLCEKGWVADERTADDASDTISRHLLIYADLEGVLDIVQRGMHILGMETPEVPVADCYLPHGYQKPQPLAGATIEGMLRDIEQNGVTLLRLTELTRALYDDRLDEEALMAQIDAEKLRPLLQATLQLLSEQTRLTEGFMPCAPADNNVTQNLRIQIENHLRII